MLTRKKNLKVLAVCAMLLAGASVLPNDMSFISSAHAKGNGGGHGGGSGNGGGNGGGHGEGGASGNGSGHGQAGEGASGNGSSHAGTTASKGISRDRDNDEKAEKAVRDHGISGKHYGRTHTTTVHHRSATSSIAKSKDTRGLTKATAISNTTPGDHNVKGLEKAEAATEKNDL